jgi:adenine/guanine phosphoribosyltransferase-like PRPP-binding protein
MKSHPAGEIIRVAKEMESKYGVKTSVIAEDKKSLMTWGPPLPITIFLITPMSDNHQLLKKARNEYETEAVKKGCTIMETPPIEEWVQMIRKNPEVIKYNIGAIGLIPPFFFHTELYGGYAKPLVTRLREEFGPLIDKEVKECLQKRMKIYGASLGQMKTSLKRVEETGTKVLGRLEQRELFNGLNRMANQIQTERIDLIIVVDRDARHLGEPLRRIVEQTQGRKLGVFYLSPEPVSRHNLELSEPEYAQARKLLEREKPKLVRAVRGKRVMIIDDLKSQGYTFRNLCTLLSKFAPAQISHGYIREYHGLDLSWSAQEITNLRKREQSFISERERIGRGKARNLRGLRRNVGIIEQKVIARLKKR